MTARDAALLAAADALAAAADALRAAAEAGEPVDGPERLLSITAAAAAMSVGRSALYSELQSGRLRSMKVGRRRLVPSSAIAGYIAEREAPRAGEMPQGAMEARRAADEPDTA